MQINLQNLDSRLWATAYELLINETSEFSNPILSIIFLRYAKKRFHEADVQLVVRELEISDIEKFAIKPIQFSP